MSNNWLGFLTASAAIGGYFAYKALGPQKVVRGKYVTSQGDELCTYERDPNFTDAKRVNDMSGYHYGVGVDSERKISIAKTGVASLPPTTVYAVFKKAVANFRDQPAIAYERGVPVGEEKKKPWKIWTWQQYHDEVMAAARAFVALGLKRFQAVNVLGTNAPEWVFANMASIFCLGKAAGIYPTNKSPACKYISEHSEAAIIVVENKTQLDKVLVFRGELPLLKAIVMWEGEVDEKLNADPSLPRVLSWKQLLDLGNDEKQKANLQAEVDARIAETKPGHCSTLIYTSGTTGNPKAVMISHDSITWTPHPVIRLQPTLRKEGEHTISYLPLSHIAAQMLDIHFPIAACAEYGVNVTVWFARPDALKDSLGITLKDVRPTLFLGVPRVWEKMQEKMMEVGKKTTGFRKQIAAWAKGLGAAAHEAKQLGGAEYTPSFLPIADKLVFSKVRAAVGMDRCRSMYTSAAPISKETLRFFGALGINILEIYGMSECTGPQTIAQHDFFVIGSCGPTMPGAEIKIDHVPGRDKPGHGEICFRGRHIMMGYMKDPVKTREAIDADGFLHSGDVGTLDANNCLYITGRIKELLITAGGENVAPVPVEDCIKKHLPAISNVMMIGDRRKYNTCFITLKTTTNANGDPTDQLAGAALDVSPESKTVAQAKADPKWKAYIERGIAAANKEAVSNAGTVQKYTILDVDFSMNSGELTPTMKLKRSEVAAKYSALIEQMYADVSTAPAK